MQQVAHNEFGEREAEGEVLTKRVVPPSMHKKARRQVTIAKEYMLLLLLLLFIMSRFWKRS